MSDSPDQGKPSIRDQIYDQNKYDSHGFRGNVVLEPDGFMSYNPLTNTFGIGPLVREYYDEGKHVLIDLAALHEDDHRRYFELTAMQQEDLHTAFLHEVQSNTEFWSNTLEFAEELYASGDYLTLGRDYYHYYIIDNPNGRGIKKHSDGKIGLITLPLKSGDVKVHVGLFLTELISYMSA